MIDAGDIIWLLGDILLDVSLFDSTMADPKKHRISFTPEEVDKIIHQALERQAFPNLPTQHRPELPGRQKAYRQLIGSKAWAQLSGELERIDGMVKHITEGLTAQEIEALAHSEAASNMLHHYALLANTAASKQQGDATLSRALEEGLPKLKESMHGHVKDGAPLGSFKEWLDETLSSEELRQAAKNKLYSANTVRYGKQSPLLAFRTPNHFSTAVGSAARFKQGVDVGLLFWGGAAGLAHTAYLAWQPKRNEENGTKDSPTWTGVVMEGSASLGALIGSLMLTSRRI